MFINLVRGLFFALLSFVLQPKQPKPEPAEQLEGVPRSDEGDPILIHYGSPWVKAAQVGWSGDFTYEEIEGDKK